MRYTKSALGLLNAQYRSVLKKCLLINLGLFALAAISATPAMATDILTTGGKDGTGVAFQSQPSVSVTGLSISDTTGLQAALDAKANATTTYTKSETDTLLGAKANASDVYTKSDVTTLLNAKANSADVYSKTETYTQAEVNSKLADYTTTAKLQDGTTAINASTLKANGKDVLTTESTITHDKISDWSTATSSFLTSHQSITEGSTNGTIKVGTTDVAVHGLGSAAYANATDFAAAGIIGGSFDTTNTVAKAIDAKTDLATVIIEAGKSESGTLGATIDSKISSATTGMLTSSNYATTLDSVYAKTGDIKTKTSELTNDSGYQTSTEVSSAISTAIAGKQNTIDGSNKLSADYIKDGTTNKVSDWNQAVSDVATLKGTGAGSVSKTVNDAITALDLANTYQAKITSSAKLDADLVDDSTSTHKFVTDAEKTKLSGIETGAQVNKIETIKIGTTDATITGKTVTLGTMAGETAANYYTKTAADAEFQNESEVKALITAGAGDGLVSSTTGVLAVNVDGSTLEVSSDKVQIKNGGVGENQLAANAVTSAKIADHTITGDDISTSAALSVASVTASGAVSAATVSAANLQADASNKLTTSGLTTSAATVGTLGVTGAATFDGAVTLGDAAGDAITVNGTATFGQQINATNGIKVGSAAGITSTVANQLNMGGNSLTNVQGLTLTDGSTNSATLSVDGTGIKTGDKGIDVGTGALKGATLTTTGDATVGGALGVSGNATVNGSATVGSLQIGSTTYGITSAGVATLGATTVSSLDAGSGLIKTTGKVEAGTLETTGAATIGGKLTVSAGGADITGNTLVKGTFGAGSDGTKFTVDANGNITNAGTVNATGIQTSASTVALGGTGYTTTVTGKTILDATSGLQFGASGQNVNAIDATATTGGVSTKSATTLATVTTVLTSAENADYTNLTTTTTGNITTATNLKGAINTLDTEIGADADYAVTYNGVAGTNTVKANLNAVNANLGNVAGLGDGTAWTGVSGYDATAAGANLTAAVGALNNNVHTVFGGVYKNDGTYDNTAIAGTNGFDNAATNLTGALTNYANHVAAATGVSYAADGSVTTAYTRSSANYAALTTGTSLKAAIEKLDSNIGDAMTSVQSRTTGTVAANNTINTNLQQLDAAIGSDTDLLTTTVSTNTGDNNGVKVANSVNKNIAALNAAVGDVSKLNAGTASKGDAITKGTGTAATTIVAALNNIDETLGNIHGLANTDGSVNNTNSTTANGTNLAKGTTVEDHLVSLDNAVGDRTTLASLNADINNETKKSVAKGLEAAGNKIGDADFASTKYASGDRDLSSAIRSLDSNIYRIDREVSDLKHDFRSGMASMAAMTALVPNARSQGDTSLSLGTGAYEGHTAMAIGGFHYINDNLLLNAGVAWGNSNDMTYRMGVTYSW